jgi:prephenate dehydrogenase
VVELEPARHDQLVAVVSHVPHLTAVTLMRLAVEGAEEHGALLRLAAGGFRDMTRIAAGHPGIWPDICAENQEAIVEVLLRLEQALATMRENIAGGDRDALLGAFEEARAARLNLAARVSRSTKLAEVRVPVPDRPGVLAEITTLASELAVNILDLEIAHSSEGDAGVVILVVEQSVTDVFRGGLLARGYRPAVQAIE